MRHGQGFRGRTVLVAIGNSDAVSGKLRSVVDTASLEGAGAAPLAALLYKRPPKKFPAVMVLSGGNIDVNFLAQITERGLFRSGRLIRLRFLVTDRPGSLAALLAAVARERSNVVSIEHDRLPPDCPPGYSAVVLLLETRDRAHGEELAVRLAGQGFRPTN